MGVLHGRDIMSGKFITAIISDSANRLHFVPIKHQLGDYFLTELDNQLFIFKIDGRRIKTYRQTLTKAFSVLQYDTTHFLPISDEIPELELMLKKNNLHNVDGMLFSILKILGKKEKANGKFEGHEIKKMLEDIGEKKDEYSEETRNMITYLDHLDIDKIVTPVKRLSEFLEGDLLATDPKFYATVASFHERADKGNQVITNASIGAKTAWLKIILVVMMIAMVGFVLYFAYDQGWFDSLTDLTKGLEGFQGIPSPTGSFNPPTTKDAAYYQNNFTPEELKAAVDRGEIDEDDLPGSIKEMIKNVETPTVEIIP